MSETMTPAQRIEQITGAWESFLLATQQRAPRKDPLDYVYASNRQQCSRRMCLDLTHPGDREPFNAKALANMDHGNEREERIRLRLPMIGRYAERPFSFDRTQERFELKDRKGRVIIVGKVDGIIRFDDGEEVPLEIKAGRMMQYVNVVDDFNRSIFTWNKLDQMLAYLLGFGKPWGLFALDRPGMPELLPVVLEDHLDRAEGFLQDAETAVAHRLGEVDLPPHVEDLSLCRICPHYEKSCSPPAFDSGAGLRVIQDERLIELAELREKNREAAKEFEKADKVLKRDLRGIEQGIMGRFRISGKFGRSTSYDIPKEIREQYKVIDDQGRFSLKIEALEGDGDE